FLRIAARDLTGLDDLEQVGADLAALGNQVLESACSLAAAGVNGDSEGESNVRLAVIGMGKLGGSELNYSSDIDVLFVGDGPRDLLERRARAVMEIARQCFRVDANLRPEGRDGPLVRSLDSYEAYWDKWAEPWEFQALLKARPAAGDPSLGQRWLDAAQRWLWSHPFDADDLRSLRAMKARAEAEVARKGLTGRELKRGQGGIRDIEFTVQLLQLVHGHLDPELRGPTTLTTLEEMTAAGYVDPDDAIELAEAYRLLRTVEHRLQLVDEQQVHTLPSEVASLDHLARVMGLRDAPEGTAAEQLVKELRRRQATVRGIHERVYFRPLLEAFATTHTEDASLSPEAAAARLSAFGFLDARRTQAAVKELTRGLNRSSRLMQQLLPLLLDWLSQSPDPDLGLLVLRNLLSGSTGTRTWTETFRDSPDSARALCCIAGTSRLLGDILTHNPDLIARLPHPERLATRDRAGLVSSGTKAVQLREGRSERQLSLRRWHQRNLLGIAARDVLGHATVRQVGIDLTVLADATLETALASLEPTIPFAVIGMGRLGGAELAYASDLDVVFVHDGTGAAASEEAKRLATALMRLVGGSTPADQVYDIDADLRPEGKNGPLSRSLNAFEVYWRDHALTWERQAMTRARIVAGDRDVGNRLLDTIEPYVWDNGLSAEEIREIRRMKARIESERIPMGEDPDFHLKLGRGSLSDVEFTVQLLQLQYGVKATGTLDALRALTESDVLAVDDATVLAKAYAFCERVRNRWYLVNSAPGDSLPAQPESLLWLSRALDTQPPALREDYRRVTRRSRKVVERIFYGLPG
ncbi:MAG TPA: bifunctional [glutamine synthetase] adenylyltransferase/[glutamine synthetase]-adenylyl-L-tyrosine phosphorylase, partial [Acidimicrobiales bacterium]